MDVVALLVLVGLALLGLLKPQEALSGFSNEAVVTLATMFALAAGLQGSGALSGVGALVGKSKSPTIFLLMPFAVLAPLGPFVVNIAVVAVLIRWSFRPARAAAKRQLHRARAARGARAQGLARCVDLDDLYETMDWRVPFLMAGLILLGVAMSKTGTAQFIVDHTVGLVTSLGPHAVLAVLYLMTLLLAELMSHSASAVMLTPVALSTARLMHADPTPFLVAAAFSSSTSFLTPIGHQANTMVYGAGGYRFSDFVKVGLPLNLLFLVLGVIFIPLFWPFRA